MYLRVFSHLLVENTDYISSQELAFKLHLNPPQIRKDLSYFGAFGTRGIGYPVDSTTQQIREILKLDVTQQAVLIGAGRLGTAIASYPGFALLGFDITAIYDINPKKIGKKIAHAVVQDFAAIDTLKELNIRLAILAVPSETAQDCAEKLVRAGIRGILNLTPCYLDVPAKVKVVTIDIAMELGILPYYI